MEKLYSREKVFARSLLEPLKSLNLDLEKKGFSNELFIDALIAKTYLEFKEYGNNSPILAFHKYITNETHYEMERRGFKFDEEKLFGEKGNDEYFKVRNEVTCAFFKRAYQNLSSDDDSVFEDAPLIVDLRDYI